MADVRFDVLGPLVTHRDGGPVDVPRGRQRLVLADLLVHAGRPVTVDALVEAGWGDDLPAHPKATLYTTVSRLRDVLGAAIVGSAPAGYLLDVSDDQIDARRFERLRSDAVDAPPRLAAELLDEALALWRGPAYAEFADLEFATIEAQRLDQLRLDSIERRERLRVDADDCAEAVARLVPVVEAHPYREQAIELLMTALYRCGRVTAALDRYRAYRTILADELGLDPSPTLRDLEERILGHDLPRRRRSPGSVPVPVWLDTSTAFIGRDEDQHRLSDAVTDSRLVTVTGPGGVGKSRLVAQSLPRLAEAVGAPVAVIELGSVRPGGAAAAVAEALGLTRRSSSVWSDVLDYLAITDLLLVLDDCEHLLPEIAALADSVTRRCPRVRVLVTSRHRLGTASERVVPLAPLTVAAASSAPEQVRRTPAVRLLTDRVRRIQPGYPLADDALAIAADICRRVDGLPLAIELAAAQVAVLGMAPVRDRLEKNPMALDDRHGSSVSVRAMVESSIRLRTSEQRRLLRIVSVLPADFDLQTVEGLVSGLRDWPRRPSVASTLGELVEASLLTVRTAEEDIRYRMLTMVRAVAADLLAESGESGAVHRVHARWARQLAETAAAESVGPGGAGAFTRLDTNRSSIVAAVRWALGSGDLDLAAAITGPIELCPHWSPDTELSELIVSVGERCARSTEGGASLPVGAAAMALADRGDLERARALATRAHELADTPRETYLALLSEGVASVYAGDLAASERCWHEIAAIPGLPTAYRAEAATSLAFLDCQRHDIEAAQRHAARAIELADASGAPAVQAFALYASGEVALRRDQADGLEILREAATRARNAGAAHVAQVARLAALSALVRLDHRRQAVGLALPLLEDERRTGAWPQLWTTVRILAELFASDRPEDAVFLLSAADTAPSAPPLAGADLHRYGELSDELTERLGATVAARIALLARGIPRAQVLDRTVAMLDGRLAAGRLLVRSGEDVPVVLDVTR